MPIFAIPTISTPNAFGTLRCSSVICSEVTSKKFIKSPMPEVSAFRCSALSFNHLYNSGFFFAFPKYVPCIADSIPPLRLVSRLMTLKLSLTDLNSVSPKSVSINCKSIIPANGSCNRLIIKYGLFSVLSKFIAYALLFHVSSPASQSCSSLVILRTLLPTSLPSRDPLFSEWVCLISPCCPLKALPTGVIIYKSLPSLFLNVYTLSVPISDTSSSDRFCVL